MGDETQKRLITILSSGIAYALASRLADRLIDEPEVRGVGDDVKEALLPRLDARGLLPRPTGRRQSLGLLRSAQPSSTG
ncbi:MAG: hypothetical protein M3P37_02675 [Actinomycetota bacterium]|nr:hypothetical protein [Actinomycetota bacterium]